MREIKEIQPILTSEYTYYWYRVGTKVYLGKSSIVKYQHEYYLRVTKPKRKAKGVK